MMKLNRPLYNLDDTVDLCVEGVSGNNQFKIKLVAEKQNLLAHGAHYEHVAESASLYSIQPLIARNNEDPLVTGALRKSELEKIYTQYFVPEKKPARVIYNSIKNSANDKCPFCGGIGSPQNIDHFLPKAHFPQFSILPLNLVPSCLDCNLSAKGHTYSTVAETQIIHPYVDGAHFFDEQWIFARFHEASESDSWYFEFFVAAPEHWTDTDKRRASVHFDDFLIAEKYGKQAADEYVSTQKQIEIFKRKGLSRDDILEALVEPKITECHFVNHWRSAMYQAIKEQLQKVEL